MIHLQGVLLKVETLEPRPPYTTPATLLTVFDEEAGAVYNLTASDEAAAALADAAPRSEVTLTLRTTEINLKSATNGALGGRAYRLRAIGAAVAGGRGR